MKTICYTYLIGWSKLNKWYYGARYRKNCHPCDFWIKYFTSSKEVKKLRQEMGEPDIKEIRKTWESSEEFFKETQDKVKKYESTVLQRLDVINSEKWLNKNDMYFVVTENGIKKFKVRKKRILTEKEKEDISKRTLGTKVYNNGIINISCRLGESPEGFVLGSLHKHTEEFKQKMSKLMKNKIVSEETRKKASLSKLGKSNGPMSEETKEKIRITHTGKKHPWNQITNKNPEKIRKMAEKHRGMKRSEESKLRMSLAKKGKPTKPTTLGKIAIHNLELKKYKFIFKDEVIPEGWELGGRLV